jgi:hypothetical protein
MIGGVDVGRGGQPDPAVVAVAHQQLMTAYRRTLRAGDEQLSSWAQRMVVHAVALSSRRAARLLLTRLDGTRALAAETDEFATALSKDDLAASLLRRIGSLLAKPFSSWKKTATTVSVLLLTAYYLAIREEGPVPWALAAAAFSVSSFTLSWVVGRLHYGRADVEGVLNSNLKAEEDALFELFGRRQTQGSSVLCCAPPRQILLSWGVNAAMAALAAATLACEALWVKRVVELHPRKLFEATDVVLAVVPFAIFFTAAVAADCRDPLRDAASRAAHAVAGLLHRHAAVVEVAVEP